MELLLFIFKSTETHLQNFNVSDASQISKALLIFTFFKLKSKNSKVKRGLPTCYPLVAPEPHLQISNSPTAVNQSRPRWPSPQYHNRQIEIPPGKGCYLSRCPDACPVFSGVTVACPDPHRGANKKWQKKQLETGNLSITKDLTGNAFQNWTSPKPVKTSKF